MNNSTGDSQVRIATQAFAPDGFTGALLRQNLLPGEIAGVTTELLGLRGPLTRSESSNPNEYVILLGLSGSAVVRAAGETFEMADESIVRLPHARDWSVEVADKATVSFLRIGAALNAGDLAAIAAKPEAHARMIARRFADCPAYTEVIKSPKTLNRMLLLEGEVPRFGAGTVETAGPDSVAAHEHPILDQHFLGLRGCRCTVHVGQSEALLTHNSLVHIPLGSRHWVDVAAGDRLHYLWLDFFRRIEDQSFLTTAHPLIPPVGRP